MKFIDIFMQLFSFKLGRYILTLLVFLLIPNIVSAVDITNMYQVDIQVKEQSNTARWKASLEGFKQVLVRRSGSSRILNSSETLKAYKKVTSYLQKFEYSSNTEVIDGNNYVISLYFEPRLIDNLIKSANQQLWDFNRPVTILWLAQEELARNSSLYRRIIVENPNEIDMYTLISKNSKRRGVPIILPLMDLEDDLLVTQSDVWGRFPEAIINANNRYSVDSMIIGKIYQRDGLWLGQFTYLNKTRSVSFHHQSEDVKTIYKQMFDSLAETLCEQYCVTQVVSETSSLFLEIENISSFKSFQILKKYLSELSAVRQVDVLNIHQDKVLLRVSLLSSEQAVIDSLSLNRHLELIEKEKEAIDENADTFIVKVEPESLNVEELKIRNDTNTIEIKPVIEPNTIFYRWID